MILRACIIIGYHLTVAAALNKLLAYISINDMVRINWACRRYEHDKHRFIK